MLTFSRLTAGSKLRLGYVRVSTYVTLFHSFYISFSLSSEFPDASRSRNCIRDGADVRICISADRVYRKYTMQRVRGDIVAFNGRKKREKKRHQCERTHGEEVTDGIVTRISNVRRWIKSGRAYLVHAIPHRLLEFRLTSDKAERSTSALEKILICSAFYLMEELYLFLSVGIFRSRSLWRSARRAKACSDETSLRIKWALDDASFIRREGKRERPEQWKRDRNWEKKIKKERRKGKGKRRREIERGNDGEKGGAFIINKGYLVIRAYSNTHLRNVIYTFSQNIRVCRT